MYFYKNQGSNPKPPIQTANFREADKVVDFVGGPYEETKGRPDGFLRSGSAAKLQTLFFGAVTVPS